jgi:hypothetical protein
MFSRGSSPLYPTDALLGFWRSERKITTREASVDDLKGIDVEIPVSELKFPKIYVKQRVKGEEHHASPSTFITRVARALSCSD